MCGKDSKTVLGDRAIFSLVSWIKPLQNVLSNKTTALDICCGKELVLTVHELLYVPKRPISVVLLRITCNFFLELILMMSKRKIKVPF